MVLLATSTEWLTQSQLLLQARPESARVTSKYTPNPPSKKRKLNPSHKRKRGAGEKSGAVDKPGADAGKNAAKSDSEAEPPPPATLTMKTYDPVSGVCLKYKTEKQQEVGRLIGVGGLASIAKVMVGDAKSDAVVVEGAESGTPANDVDGDMDMDKGQETTVADGEADGKPGEPGHKRAKKSVSFAAGVEVHKMPPQQSGGGGGGGGKKKGKKGKGR